MVDTVKVAYPRGPLPGLARTNTTMSSPIHPSPLREAAVLERQSLNNSPETPALYAATLKNRASDDDTKGGALTPPDSTHVPAGPRATGSMGDFRYDGETFDPSTWRNENFVHASSSADAEDPFMATPPQTDTKLNVSAGVFSPSPQETFPSPQIRPDRVGQPVTPENAQGVLPAQNAVFVANLSNQKNDEELEDAVTLVFGQYGPCHVKIRRDRNKMPFAFVIYQQEQDARAAINQGRGVSIHGRRIRTEHAKVERTIVLSRVTGGEVSEKEAHELLQQYGAIDWMGPVAVRDQALLGLPEGMWVKFVFYQDCRDAQIAFKSSQEWTLQYAKNQDLASQLFGHETRDEGSVSPLTAHGRRTARYERPRFQVPDGCAIFVGNLPADASKTQLESAFERFGHVASVDIIQKPSPNNNRLNTFAFVGFHTPEEAQRPIGKDIRIGQWNLRVEAKEYNFRRRAGFQVIGSPNRAPNSAMPLSQSNEDRILGHLYNESISLGLSREKAARILHINKIVGVDTPVQPTYHPSPRYAPLNPSYGSPMPAAMYHHHGMIPSPLALHPTHHNGVGARHPMSPTHMPTSDGMVMGYGAPYHPHTAYTQYQHHPYEMAAMGGPPQVDEQFYNGGAVELSTIHEGDENGATHGQAGDGSMA